MRDYNYTVVTVRENHRTVTTRMTGFDTLVDAVEYVDDRVNAYQCSNVFTDWSVELVDNSAHDTLFLLTSR